MLKNCRSIALVFALLGAVAASGCSDMQPSETSSETTAQATPKPAVTAAATPATESAPAAKYEVGAPRVRIRWTTETETNTFGYFVYRAESADGKLACLNTDNPIPASGTTTTPYRYTYYDMTVEAGKQYFYKVVCTNLDGSEEPVFKEDRLPAQPKPLTAEELEDIHQHGLAYKQENIPTKP